MCAIAADPIIASTAVSRRAHRSLGVALATLVLLGALAPAAAASGWSGRPDRWPGADAARSLAPTPFSAVVQTIRARPSPRGAPAGHGPFTAAAIQSVRRSGTTGGAPRLTLLQTTPSLVRRRGPPTPTS